MIRVEFSLLIFVYLIGCHDRGAVSIEVLKREHQGILSEQDFNSVKESLSEVAYRGGLGIAYWVCFRTDSIDFKCSDDHYSAPGWGRMATETIKAHRNDEMHDYFFRRGMTLYFCNSLLKEWNRIKENEPYACFSGYPSGEEIGLNDGVKAVNYGWVLDKIKTKKGCVAYFGLEAGCNSNRVSKSTSILHH